MNRKNIKELIKEAFTDNVYGKYPYSHRRGDEEEASEDFVDEWKKFSLEMVRDPSRKIAIAIAKILVKDIELFEDVLVAVGQSQSLGVEILKQMEDSEIDNDPEA